METSYCPRRKSTLLGAIRGGGTPLPFDIPFLVQKLCTPLVYLLLKNGTPFTYLVQNFAIILTAVNALFAVINKPRTGAFSGLFHSREMNLLALLSHFTDRNDTVSTRFIYIKPEKVSLSGGAYPHSHYREDPGVC